MNVLLIANIYSEMAKAINTFDSSKEKSLVVAEFMLQWLGVHTECLHELSSKEYSVVEEYFKTQIQTVEDLAKSFNESVPEDPATMLAGELLKISFTKTLQKLKTKANLILATYPLVGAFKALEENHDWSIMESIMGPMLQKLKDTISDDERLGFIDCFKKDLKTCFEADPNKDQGSYDKIVAMLP